MAEDGTQLVGLHLAEIGSLAAQRSHAGCRVASRSAGDLDGLAHVAIELFGTYLVDQVHRALHQSVPGYEILSHACNHIDDRVANAENVETGSRHEKSPCPVPSP